jgi:uncharacterized protein (TIGR02270 family)
MSGPPVIASVLDRHAEEAAFLWLLRDRAVGLPQFNLRFLAELDQRVEAHLDGLRVAGPDGWKRVWEEFEANPGPGEAFAAGVLAFEAADPAAIERLLAAADSRPPLTRAVASAVGWLTDDAAAVALPLLKAAGGLSARRVGLAAAAVRRVNPGADVLEAALRDPDTRLRARACEAVGELGDGGRKNALKANLADRDAAVRFAAAWASARMGGSEAVGVLQELAFVEPRHRTRAVMLAVRRLDPAAAARWVKVLETLPGCERAAVRAAGALGDPAFVPSLIERMSVPALARPAGEAFTLITGANLAAEKLDGVQPAGFEGGPTDDPDDPDVSLDPDDGLDWPDVEKVKAWWAANGGRFGRGVRHLCGRPINPDHLRHVLRHGYQRQRAAAAIELALLNPRQPLIEVRAPGWRQ